MSCTIRSKAGFILPLLLVLAGAAARAQPAFQVKDLNTTRSVGISPQQLDSSFYDNFASAGGMVFFGADDGVYGYELWRTDGTEAGTGRVADVCPGACASSPQNLTAAGGRVFFTTPGEFPGGEELWKSDGTAAGTVRVKDLIPEGEGGIVWGLRELAGQVVFLLARDGQGPGLWRSDGTAAGTVLLAPFEWSSEGLSVAPLARLGGKLLFVATDTAHGREVWTTDGTAAGTVLLKDVVPGPASGFPGYETTVAVAGGKVFFVANWPASLELWVSDGTTAGTVAVPGTGRPNPRELTAVGSEVFFFANETGIGFDEKLWKSDGTAAGTQPVGSVPPSAQRLTEAGGRLFFFDGCDLWTSAGGSVTLVRSAAGCYPPPIVGSGGKVLFFGSDVSHGREPWTSDGTPAGTTLAADLYPGPSGSIDESQGLFAGGRWYFRSKGEDNAGARLWTTDGTAAGTRTLLINPQKSGLYVNPQGEIPGPRPLLGLEGTLLFQGDDGTAGSELWRSDGTAAGTSLVMDLWPGPLPSFPGELTRLGDAAVFRTGLETFQANLWKTDGTPGGTQSLFEATSGTDFPLPHSPRELTPLGDGLLFVGPEELALQDRLMKNDGTPGGTVLIEGPGYVNSIVSLGSGALLQVDGQQLWKSDGSAAGTISLASVLPGPNRRLPELSAARDGVLFFAGSTKASGEELWQSDGTVDGTHLVAETVPGPGSKRLGPFATAGPAVFFAAGGNELWKNAAGSTSLVRALPGGPGAGIRSLTALGAKVGFTYDDGVNGRELWVSDGTEAGTRLLKDVLPGPGSSHPRQLHVEGNVLVFSASDGVHGQEPWRSDGTALGTRMLQDIAPGVLPSSPSGFTASGANVYFAANDGTTGFELWALPQTALLSTFADVPADHWAFRFVEALAANGLTGGCAPGNFCPLLPVSRAEAAVFLVRASHGPAFVPPPATGTRFQDVPAGYWAAPWIEQFATDGVTSGCGGGNFCPAAPLTRAEAAVFLLKSRYGSGFVPPPATGTVFNDVPADYWAARWIERLAAEQVTAGCGGGGYCPAATTTRAEMAVLLTRLFGLLVP